MPPDVEPLYQYINTAEFLRETYETSGVSKGGVAEEEGEGQNQLSLARQLSMRKLWCEQPDVISSGILQVLTAEERNLQEVSGSNVPVLNEGSNKNHKLTVAKTGFSPVEHSP